MPELTKLQIALPSLLAGALCLAAPAAEAVDYRSILGWESDGSTINAYLNKTTPVPASYAFSGVGYSARTFGSALDNGTAFAESASTIGTVQAGTRITYTASLSGPPGGLIPVEVIVSGYAHGYGAGYAADASIGITSSFVTLLSGNAGSSTGEAPATLSIDSVVMLAPNTDFTVTLNASTATFEPYLHAPEDATATVDPQFIIDPAYASRYHFEGLPTVSAVPEPATWLLLYVGIAACAWRRRTLR